MRIEIKAILPPASDKVLTAKTRALEIAVEAAMRGPIKEHMKKAFEKRVKGWSTKPSFVGVYSHYKGAVGSLLVYPRGEKKWEWVSGGVPGRVIVPVRSDRLRFRANYRPHTKVGNIYGGPGERSGAFVEALSVQWPGIQPRDFEKHIVDEEEGPVVSMLSAIMRRVLS